MSKNDAYAKILGFIQDNGQPLLNYGTSESGLSRATALRVLEMFEQEGITPLGIEVWRFKNDRYDCDVMSGWYSNDMNSALTEARRFLENFSSCSEGDLFTIQF